MLAQARHSPPFPIENESLGAGRSPLLMGVPVAFYSTIFRPQFLGFFLFDFEHAFSFFWCAKIFGLLLAFPFLLRQLEIRNPWIIAFGTVWLFFSSFVQWWFSSPPMLPEMLASWAIVTGCALKLFSASKTLDLALALTGFVFFGANFALCMYPGFQIPLVYVSVAIMIGTWLRGRTMSDWRTGRGVLLLSLGIFFVVAALIPHWLAVRDTLRILAATGYPGVLRSHGGSISFGGLFSGILGFFESEQRIPFHYDNICEASNFYPLWVAALGVMVFAKQRNAIPVPPLCLTLLALIMILAAYCLFPTPLWLARISLLGLALENRLLLGIGVANVLLCCVFFDSYRQPIWNRSGAIAIILAAVSCAVGMIWLRPFPENIGLCFAIVAINSAIVGLFFWAKARTLFLAVFAALVVLNGVGINPVMRSLSPLIESTAFSRVDKLRNDDPSAKWVVYSSEELPQLVKATGANVLNGTKIVPDLAFMRSLDSDGRLAWIYDRFAHLKVILPEEPGVVTFNLIGSYFVELGLPPDDPVLREHNYSYFVFPEPWPDASRVGFNFVEQVEPGGLYIFRRPTDH